MNKLHHNNSVMCTVKKPGDVAVTTNCYHRDNNQRYAVTLTYGCGRVPMLFVVKVYIAVSLVYQHIVVHGRCSKKMSLVVASPSIVPRAPPDVAVVDAGVAACCRS
ncbi:hypothetical protein EVAR_86001_1 [Eumeta japonica]|uniref:Uncharacterized protein n=1 Tax=Eumeta variegata TaxID=151549 RepID=A0A4C1UJJ8_EUMVA|nr:hypothetical protein EVAR_86001_1 [Eumeta japonica]